MLLGNSFESRPNSDIAVPWAQVQQSVNRCLNRFENQLCKRRGGAAVVTSKA